MSSTVLSLVPGPSRAKRIADDWRAADFPKEEISVVIPQRFGSREFAFDWLVDLSALALPGMGSFLATGPLFDLMKGAAGVGTGGVRRALESLGFSEFDAQEVEIKLKAGSSLAAVHVEDKADELSAQEICERHGAELVYITEGTNAESANNAHGGCGATP